MSKHGRWAAGVGLAEVALLEGPVGQGRELPRPREHVPLREAPDVLDLPAESAEAPMRRW